MGVGLHVPPCPLPTLGMRSGESLPTLCPCPHPQDSLQLASTSASQAQTLA